MTKILIIFSFLTVIFIPAFSYAGPPADDEDSRYDCALDTYLKGSLDKAATAFREYLRDYPKGEHADDSLYWLGKYNMLKGSFSDAAIELRQAVDDLPTSDLAASMQFELGYCLYVPDNPERNLNMAFEELMKVPAAFPDDPVAPQALFYAAKCRMELKNYTKAKEIFNRVIKDYPASPYAAPALYGLGMSNIIEGKTADAERAFRTAAQRYPAGLYSEKAESAVKLIEQTREKGLNAGPLFDRDF